MFAVLVIKQRVEEAVMLIRSLCSVFPCEQEGNFGVSGAFVAPGGASRGVLLGPAETSQGSSSHPEQQRAGGWSSRKAQV